MFMTALVLMSYAVTGSEVMNISAILEQTRIEKLGHYSVRTQYTKPGGSPTYTNRLILEDSPYLLQHAHNPVDWYTWSDEAFAAARRENKPIFLSIGYATCHWCHVMEEESFDNEAVARVLNQHFISIKVDREQRPDLDAIYMTGAMLVSGQAGWPMSAFVTADGKPFYAASYFPRDVFLDLLAQIQTKWTDERTSLDQLAEKVYLAIVSEGQYAQSAEQVTSASIDSVLQRLLDYEDPVYGGINEEPKFPMEPKQFLLLSQLPHQAYPDQGPLWDFMAGMLNGMLLGGIYDQIGGGFHRYATDKAWRIPHFEKTLYNQAQLAQIYNQAWQISGDPEYQRISAEILDYVLKDMRAPGGCFYAATDADSEGEEGTFYLWQPAQLDKLFKQEDALFIQSLYGISPAGNFNGANILHLPLPLQDVAANNKLAYSALIDKITPLRQQMALARSERVAPLVDIKQISQWNAMMIMALASGGQQQNKPHYIEAAIQCADVIWQRGRDGLGHLYRSIVASQASVTAGLADHGYLLQAMLVLYDVSADKLWLDRAKRLHQNMTTLFEDPQQGGFYNSAEKTRGPLPIRDKASQDIDTASGNSAALMGLVMLAQRSDIPSLKKQIDSTISYFAAPLNQRPLALPAMLTAISQYRTPAPAAIAYAAKGKVRIETAYVEGNHEDDKDGSKKLKIRITIADGWHINSHQPLQKNLIGTRVEAKNLPADALKMSYPEGKIMKLGFSELELSLYENSVELSCQLMGSDLSDPWPHFQVFSLRLQVCSDKICLPPESVLIHAISKV